VHGEVGEELGEKLWVGVFGVLSGVREEGSGRESMWYCDFADEVGEQVVVFC
jgi:hypothetical protein